ncbi:hypothetical protein ES702_00439 [subsurface metagenome]
MLPSLLETLCKANEKTFAKNQIYREKAERSLYEYIDKSLEAPLEQKKELRELIFSCLEPYKTFINMQREAIKVSGRLSPKLDLKRMQREINQKPDLERLN